MWEFTIKILVFGGAGYVGSHSVVELLQANFDITVFDNFSNSSRSFSKRIYALTGKRVNVVEGDIRNAAQIDHLFSSVTYSAVFLFAALKSPEDSISEPLSYYDNNVCGTLNILAAMQKYKVKTLIFSSSASVYGIQPSCPITEDAQLSTASSPYGNSKIMVERILSDLFLSDDSWRISILRYFNPVGGHSSGLLGESPLDKPKTLMSLIIAAASGQIEYLPVFGGNYPTVDGSGVRDFVHIMDVARGHVAAFESCRVAPGVQIVNLGTGRGISVLRLIKTFEQVNGVFVPYKIVGRRDGDVAECFADVSFAKKCLGWSAQLGIEDMCKHSWRWHLREWSSK